MYYTYNGSERETKWETVPLAGFYLLTSPETGWESLHSTAIFTPPRACSTTSDLTDSQGFLGLNDRARKCRYSAHSGRRHKNVRHRGGDLVGVNPPPHPTNLWAGPLPVCIFSSPPAHIRPFLFSLSFFWNMFQRENASLRASTASFLTEARNQRSNMFLRSVVQKKREALARKKKKIKHHYVHFWELNFARTQGL